MSDDQMSEMLKKHGVTGDTFTESQFSQLLSSLKAALPARSQVMAAFECLDPHGDGFCSAQQLKKSLMNRGKEKYSEAEADELIKASGAVDGQINYKQFIDFMTAHSIDADDPFH
jgi:Ca2+-binding EF-hand superfamily protein